MFRIYFVVLFRASFARSGFRGKRYVDNSWVNFLVYHLNTSLILTLHNHLNISTFGCQPGWAASDLSEGQSFPSQGQTKTERRYIYLFNFLGKQVSEKEFHSR